MFRNLVLKRFFRAVKQNQKVLTMRETKVKTPLKKSSSVRASLKKTEQPSQAWCKSAALKYKNEIKITLFKRTTGNKSFGKNREKNEK